MTAPAAEEIVRLYGLKPHPEGGFFRETYRSSLSLPGRSVPGFAEARSASTAILFLLPEGTFSRLHKIRSDEVWHWHLGGPLRVSELDLDGTRRETVLGPDVAAGQEVQHVVPAGTWFGARPLPGHRYALVGCTVAPGFDFADFELGRRGELLKLYPEARAVIESLTDVE